jgi:hypothetical protein
VISTGHHVSSSSEALLRILGDDDLDVGAAMENDQQDDHEGIPYETARTSTEPAPADRATTANEPALESAAGEDLDLDNPRRQRRRSK